MLRNRWTLTRSQKSEYSRAVERMRAAGADLAPFGYDCEWISVTHCPAASWVRSWTGATVFVIHVRMVGLAPKTIFRGFELSGPEWEPNAYVLDDPSVRNSALQHYRMLDKSPFERSEVLNHRIGPKAILRRGDLTEGWLLAQSFSSAPTRYNRGCPMPLVLSIINQFDDVKEFRFELPVEHVPVRVKLRSSGVSLNQQGAHRTALFSALPISLLGK